MTKEQREWLERLSDAVINAIERGNKVSLMIEDSSGLEKVNDITVMVFLSDKDKCNHVRSWYTGRECLGSKPEDLIKEVDAWEGRI